MPFINRTLFSNFFLEWRIKNAFDDLSAVSLLATEICKSHIALLIGLIHLASFLELRKEPHAPVEETYYAPEKFMLFWIGVGLRLGKVWVERTYKWYLRFVLMISVILTFTRILKQHIICWICHIITALIWYTGLDFETVGHTMACYGTSDQNEVVVWSMVLAWNLVGTWFSRMCLSDGECLYANTCGIRMKRPSERPSPLYQVTTSLVALGSISVWNHTSYH